MKRIIPAIALVGILLCSCATQRQAEPIQYKNLSEKATVTLQLDQHKYTLFCTIQMWLDELVIVSLQPTAGIEMVRIEATQDSIWVIDKMNHRYTTIAYDWARKAIRPTPSLQMLQDFLTPPKQDKKKTTNQQTFIINNHKLGITCAFSHREYDKLTTHRRLPLKKYQRVTLHEIIPL